MKKIITVVVVGFLCASLSILSGCNTVKGAGRDVSAVGHGITRAA